MRISCSGCCRMARTQKNRLTVRTNILTRTTWSEKQNCCTYVLATSVAGIGGTLLWHGTWQPVLIHLVYWVLLLYKICASYPIWVRRWRIHYSHLHAHFILSLTMNDGADIGLTTYQPIWIWTTIISSDRRQAIVIGRPGLLVGVRCLRNKNECECVLSVCACSSSESGSERLPEIYWYSNSIWQRYYNFRSVFIIIFFLFLSGFFFCSFPFDSFSLLYSVRLTFIIIFVSAAHSRRHENTAATNADR